jgi:hypothetical protein
MVEIAKLREYSSYFFIRGNFYSLFLPMKFSVEVSQIHSKQFIREVCQRSFSLVLLLSMSSSMQRV